MNAGKSPDVWNEWTRRGLVDGKRYSSCNHCGHRLQDNVTRFKQHLVLNCPSVPDDIKSKFTAIVCRQSMATNNQKRKLQLELSEYERNSCSSAKLALKEHMSDDITVGKSSSSYTLSQQSSSSARSDSENDSHTSRYFQSPTAQIHKELGEIEEEGFEHKVDVCGSVGQPKRKMMDFFDHVSPREQEELDILWAQAVYTCGWSFNCMNNPFLQEFLKKIRPSWHPPSAYQLSTKLLNLTSANVDKVVAQAIQEAPNVTIQLDGWSDINRHSLINVAAYACRPIFLKSIDPGAQRHDAPFIADQILQVINNNNNEIPYVNKSQFRSVVTDQPSVMKAAWNLVAKEAPWVNCYGCGAHVMNLLASDLRKIDVVANVLEQNRKISIFFKSHSMAKAVLSEVTTSLHGRSIPMLLGCATRWSTDYFMIRRTLRLKSALISSCIDDRLKKEFRNNPNVKLAVMDDKFWQDSSRSACLLKPVSTAIEYCEGDNVPVSVMPRIWRHISAKLDHASLTMLGFHSDEIEAILNVVSERKEMNFQPTMMAAHALDPRFHGEDLSDEQWTVACNQIVKMAAHENINRTDLVNDIAEYRSKTGLIFGDDLAWEAVNTPSCSQNPACWWQSFAAKRCLSTIAVILLSMPATAAMVERCNKAYAGQKTKSRNRLLSERAAKLASISYNLKINRSLCEPTKRSETRSKRCHILALSTTSSAGVMEQLPALPNLANESVTTSTHEEDDIDRNSTALIQSIVVEDEMENSDGEVPEDDADDVIESETDSESENGTGHVENGSESDNENDDDGLPTSSRSLGLIVDDWVAVAVKVSSDKYHKYASHSQSLASKGKNSSKETKCYLHIAKIIKIEEENSAYSVSFVKRHTDGSYFWPNPEDHSSVDRDEIVRIRKPSDDVCGASSRFRVKLTFDKTDIEDARKTLNIPLANIR